MKRLVLIAFLIAILVSIASLNVAVAAPENPSASGIAQVVFVHQKALAAASAAARIKSEGSYKLVSSGVKWADSSLPVSYKINTGSVPAGIDSAAASSQIQAAFEEWDANTSKELYNNTAGVTTKAGAALDGENIVAWAPLSDPNTIAVTYFWYYRSTRKLVEFDMVLNSAFAWGIDADGEGSAYTLAGAMDIRNIVTHEAGHTLVLADLYSTANAQMTMYGYSSYGEVKKISLAQGDIDGIHKLYGF